MPAKAAVLCCKQFNGEYGYSVCYHPGKRLGNGARVYLPDSVHQERTHAQVLLYGRKAEATQSSVNGVKGISPLSEHLDLVTSIPVDYMHAVLEGVVRRLMNSWFNSNQHCQPYYIGHEVNEIDVQLLKQHPPHEFSRPPRSIKMHLKYWNIIHFHFF